MCRAASAGAGSYPPAVARTAESTARSDWAGTYCEPPLNEAYRSCCAVVTAGEAIKIANFRLGRRCAARGRGRRDPAALAVGIEPDLPGIYSWLGHHEPRGCGTVDGLDADAGRGRQ